LVLRGALIRFLTRGNNRTNSLALHGWRLMRKGQILLVLVAVLITACGGNAGNVALKPTASAGASAQPSAESTPQQSPSPTPFDLTCRLPVISNPGSNKTNRGWVTFPGGQFSPDPSSQWNGSYDWAIHAWVPVEEWAVAPDGESYVVGMRASQTQAAGISVVNAKTGSRKVILSTKGPKAGQLWSFLAYTNKGVFLGAQGLGADTPGPPAPGLWLLDPASGRVRLIEGTHNWSGDPVIRHNMRGGGFAWAFDYPEGSAGGTGTKVYRLDFATGQIVAWYQTDSYIELMSATEDGEVLVAYGDPSRLALLDRSHQLTLLEVPAEFDALAVVTSTVAQPGLWITDSGNSLDLYQKGLGIRVMVSTPDFVTHPDSRDLYAAGDCR
jgi:hypothetical protein